MATALKGIKVLEVAQAAAAPMASRLLADLGADIIKIENPQTGDSHRYFQARPGDPFTAGRGVPSDINYNWELYNINKRSMTLNLAAGEGREVFYRLAREADVFVSNLRPFEAEKFQVTYDILEKINPRLIYANLTGYGRHGPLKDSPGYDLLCYWSRAGVPYMMDAQGFRPAFGDNLGGLMLAFGVMTALFVRERTGIGQEVDMSLFGLGIFQLAFDISGALVENREYTEYKLQGREDSLNPLVGAYMTKDGRMFMLVCLQPDRYWPKVCEALGREDLVDDPRFDSFLARMENRIELFATLDEAFASRTLEEWLPRFTGVPASPVQNLLEVVNDQQARANEMYVGLDHPAHGRIEVVAPPVRFSRTPASVRTAAPEFGQHTEEVLLETGYSWEAINQLRDNGVID